MTKDNNTLIIGVIIAIVIVLAAAFIFWTYYPAQRSDGDGQVIGGDRDSHGCLGPAGYSWNAEEKECVREWETGEARYQVINFRTCADAGYPIMKSNPAQCRTESGRTFFEEVTGEKDKVYCTAEQRNAEVCIEIYAPVCGYDDPEKIQCFKAPCAQTYDNSCFACAEEKVLYYTEGECPQ